ncbi:Serine/threonine-protein kinase/endoribonuclease IRE1 [Morus notabilis]|uniref:non-specific serine/threonine protein kinase n=1 Tax=Morus notabilis TaxID=981085 RepID=W9S9P4_9ROSA|nr:Serine/threonine-protein kinase/endoribonuclease IRE1 [Morus notabilis]
MIRKRRRFAILVLLSFFFFFFFLNDGVAAAISNSKDCPPPPPQSRTALVAAADGTIHWVDNVTMRVKWSFSSGPPIHSSYQSPDLLLQPNNFNSSFLFVDSGDDWDLYLHTLHTQVKLPITIEDLVRTTPFTSEYGAVILGSKTTTVFEVDPLLGTLIRTYSLSDPPPNSNSKYTEVDDFRPPNATATTNNQLVNSESTNQSPAKMRLQFMRTDYMLQGFAPDSDEVLWNMTIAEIGAALLCQDVDDPPTTADIALPLSCQSKMFIFRLRNHVLLESIAAEGGGEEELLPAVVHDQQHTMLMMPSSQGEKHSDVHQDHKKMLLGLASKPMLNPQAKKANVHQYDKKESVLSLPPAKTSNDSGLQDTQNNRIHWNNVFSNFFGWSSALALLIGILMGVVVHRYAPLIKGLLHEQPRDSTEASPSPSNKMKNQQSENNNDIVENLDALANSESDDKTWLDLSKLFDCGADERRIGKLVVSNREIAKGSNGTIVLEGIYEGRPVAVKRLVQAHHLVAFKEIENLIASDRHPNIVRWYGVEHDQDFVYVSLERCTCSLDDLVQIYSDYSQYPVSGKDNATIEYRAHLESVKNVMPHVSLWKLDARPSPLLLKLMRDVVFGLVHLHELGIIHRDLKPKNVLITNERSLCAKLSDMGISKRLLGDMSSLGHHATGKYLCSGSSGWQAPEQLLHGRQTRAVDLFSLGCVLFFCITGGRHPFGDRLERDINIVKNQMDLFLLEDIPEAIDLISHLLNPDPELRPKALEVLHHPLFWNSETRLSFLRDTSDRVELEDRKSGSAFFNAIESTAPIALGAKWNEKLEPVFIANIGRYRHYKYDSVRDLLRVIRNKLNHYRELPNEIQELVGPIPEGFDGYFTSRFPKLLIEVYKVMSRNCKEEECFQKYFKSNGE